MPRNAPATPSGGDQPAPEAFFWRTRDGLWLGARLWTPPPDAAAPSGPWPVLCLPGLSRNGRDFAALATRLAAAGHRVIVMDYRGRGLSDRDPDWRNYAIPIEAQDIDTGLDALGLERFAVVGTSRGGLHAMLLAIRRPAAVAAIVLNDIGPQIEMAGLRRIAESIGKDMTAPDWQTAAERLSKTFGHQFPVLTSADQWLRLARQLYRDQSDGLCLDYDPDLARPLAGLDDGEPPADLWSAFPALASVPLFILRGENSDILSPATVTRMLAEHPRADAIVVPGQGHAPMLWEDAIQSQILEFIQRAAAPR